jgi:hypothetical protein
MPYVNETFTVLKGAMMEDQKNIKNLTGMEILNRFITTGLFSETDYNEFSRFPCDACNSRLGGERWQIDGFLSLADARKGWPRKYGLSICRDCFYILSDLKSEGGI